MDASKEPSIKPIDPAEILQALTLCTQGLDPNAVATGEKVLQRYDGNQEYLPIMARVVIDPQTPPATRLMAAVQFKLHVEKFWRNGLFQLEEREKQRIRPVIFEACFSPYVDPQSAKQVVVALGKIAKFDFPKYWPGVINDIGLRLNTESDEQLIRGLQLLHECIAELSQKRLPHDRRTFFEVSAGIYPPVLNAFKVNCDQLIQGRTSSFKETLMVAKKCIYSVKVLHTLTRHGVRDYTAFQPFLEFFRFVIGNDLIVGLLKSASTYDRIDHQGNEEAVNAIKSIRKIPLRIERIILDLMEEQPLSLNQFLMETLEKVIYVTFEPPAEVHVPEKLIITGLNIIKTFNSERCYRPSREGSPSPNDEKLTKIRERFFSQNNVSALMEVLVTKFMLLTPEDIERFERDPEEFSTEIESYDSWKYGLRPAAETLLSSLCYSYADVGSQKLKDMLMHAISQPSTTYLLKEAVYLAAGLCAFHLFEVVDFDVIFRDHLWSQYHDLSNPLILRRRILWLVGEWAGVRLDFESRPALYRLFVDGLRPENHFGMRLTAAKAVKSAFDVHDFRPEDVTSVAADLLHGLLKVLGDVAGNDTQVLILTALNVALERMDTCVRPYVPQVLQALSNLWHESDDEYVVQGGIVSALKTTVSVLRREAISIQDFASELIGICTDLSNPLHVHLLPEGLELWHSLLECLETCSDPLRILLRDRLPQMLEITSEHLEIVLKVVESYMLLSPEFFMTDFMDVFVQFCVTVIPDMKEEALTSVINQLDTTVQIFDAAGVTKLVPVIEILISNIGTNASRVFSLKMGFLARCIFANLPDFTTVFRIIAEKNGIANPLQLFNEFMDMWLKKISWICKVERRKLCGLALMRMLVLEPQLMAQHFSAVISAVLEIITELCDESFFLGGGDTGVPETDMLCIPNGAAGDQEVPKTVFAKETSEKIRRDQLKRRNVCYSIDILKFSKERWAELVPRLDPALLEQLLNTLQPTVRDQLLRYFAK